MAAIGAVNEDVGVRWVTSFVSADKRTIVLACTRPPTRTPSARRRGVPIVPAEVIVRVDEIDPDKVLPAADRQQVVSSGGTSRSTR